MGRVESQFSIVKQLDKSNVKNRWWFIVKAPERSLQDLDKNGSTNIGTGKWFV